MKHYLLRYDDNWADEFDVEGFRIYDQEEYDDFKKRVKAAEYPQQMYFGTNEGIDVDSAKDYLDRIDVTEITEAEAKVLNKFFDGDYGIFLEPDSSGDEDEDDDDFEDDE
jgi:hypothetical protein